MRTNEVTGRRGRDFHEAFRPWRLDVGGSDASFDAEKIARDAVRESLKEIPKKAKRKPNEPSRA